MTEWVKCTGTNGSTVFINLNAVLTITSYGAGTRLALMGNSQTYMDVVETPSDVLALPRFTRGEERASQGPLPEESDFDLACSAVDVMNAGIADVPDHVPHQEHWRGSHGF